MFTRQRGIPRNCDSFYLFVFISRVESFHHSQRAYHVVSSLKSWAVWLHSLYFMWSTQVVAFCHCLASLPVGTTIWGIWMKYSHSWSSPGGDRRWVGGRLDNASLLPQVLAGERLRAQRSPQVSVSVWQDMYVEICPSRHLIISVYPKTLLWIRPCRPKLWAFTVHRSLSSTRVPTNAPLLCWAKVPLIQFHTH